MIQEGSSTPDSLSDYESNKTNDKRLSIAEELDATQNELTEAQEKLTQAIQQVIFFDSHYSNKEFVC